MKKSTVKKISILGLVLTAASAVTAAVLPAIDNNLDDRFVAGSLTKNSAAGGGNVSSQTCEADTTPGAIDLSCNITVSETSEDGGLNNSNSVSSAANDNGLGENNTSDNS